jgi:hypothetical protein
METGKYDLASVFQAARPRRPPARWRGLQTPAPYPYPGLAGLSCHDSGRLGAENLKRLAWSCAGVPARRVPVRQLRGSGHEGAQGAFG